MSIDFIVKNQALNQQIYTLLKQEILHHQLQPGERIVDAQVAARLGVSRTPAREAIFQLSPYRTGGEACKRRILCGAAGTAGHQRNV